MIDLLKLIAEDIKTNGKQLISGIYHMHRNSINCYYIEHENRYGLLFTREVVGNFSQPLLMILYDDKQIIEVKGEEEINKEMEKCYDSFPF